MILEVWAAGEPWRFGLTGDHAKEKQMEVYAMGSTRAILTKQLGT